MKITIRGEEITLDKEKAIYLPAHSLLAIGDLHLGKAGHFRKAGLPIPSQVATRDLERLSLLVEKYSPNTLLINGDMFHSDYNQEIADFANWRNQYQSLNIILVKGNHDRQQPSLYQRLRLTVVNQYFDCNEIRFSHDLPKKTTSNFLIISHLHPGILIKNSVKHKIKLPCFLVKQNYAVLPAFSNFTGLSLINKDTNDKVFAITPNSVIAL